MCRSIKPLRDKEQVVATDAEVTEAALQFVRKVSGYRKPSQLNQKAFDRAVREIGRSTQKLLDELVIGGAR